MKNIQIFIAVVLSLFATQVLAQNSTTTKVNVQVPGFISYGHQGQYFVPIASVSETKDAIKELGLVPDSINFVAIIPVSASGVQGNIGYDQVYMRATMQGMYPCEKWVAAKIAEYKLPVKDKVYILTDVSIAAFDKDGKPNDVFEVPIIEPKDGVLSLGKENMGTLENFSFVAKISDNGEMESGYDDLKYEWKSFPSKDSRIMVIMSPERMTGEAIKW
jgi:hypothetical protein